METVTVWVAGAAAVLSISMALLVVLVWRPSARRTSAEIAELREALAALSQAPKVSQWTVQEHAEPVVAEFLITDVGLDPQVEPIAPRLVLSATVGEPVVKAASFAYGLRRALAAENRNRIRFEMRRELRRARKARRAAGRAAAAEARSQAVS